MRIAALAVASFMALWPATSAYPARPNRKPAELEAAATHIVVGTIKQIWERQDAGHTPYVAEVLVSEVQKGDRIQKDDLIYVRYTSYSPETLGPVPKGQTGQRETP